jgi:hypothetical protein
MHRQRKHDALAAYDEPRGLGVASQPRRACSEYFNYGPPHGLEDVFKVNRIRAAYMAVVASQLALLAGCSSGAKVDIGGGQGVDPGTINFPIAYVKHYFDAQTLQDLDDLNNPGRTRLAVPDADLFLRTSSSPSATEIDITGGITTNGVYDIKDVNVSPDGTRLIFSMRGPIDVNADEIDPPFWTLWEFDTALAVSGSNPAPVIDTTLFPEAGNDVSPNYLPDGSIVFSSTRQRGSKAVLLDEGKPGYEAQFQGANESAFLLHVLSADRQNIQQISYNIGHDLWPDTLTDAPAVPGNPQNASFIAQQGRIVFSRWDNSGGGMALYAINADGSGLQLLYGARSHRLIESGQDIYGTDFQFTHPHEMQDGRILTMARPFDQDTDQGGDLVLVDTRDFVENAQPLAASSGLSGPAQQRGTPNQVTIVDGPSPGGRFRSAWPLWDGSGRILVSWSLCRLEDTMAATPVSVPCTDARLADPNYVSAPPLYSAFMFDPSNNTFKPLFVPVEGVMISDLVAVQGRAPLWVKSTDILNPLLADQGVGVLSIRSVYDFDGSVARTATGTGTVTCPALNRTIDMLADPTLCTPDDRPARFIRIEEAVSRYDRDLDMSLPDIDFGAAVGSGVGFMRVILAYAPIEPDGSVSIRVPANVPFTFSILDQNGRRLPQFSRHTSWLQLRPGEERHCNGCHQAPAGGAPEPSHGRDGTSVSAWAGTFAGTPFPNTLLAVNGTPMTGDTMALALARASCTGGSTSCSEIPRVNLREMDVWTNLTPVFTVDLSYGGGGYGIGTGLSTLAPTSSGCQLAWNGNCRIVINYEQHIHPLWSTLRQDTMDDGMGGTIVLADHTCTNCHAPANEMGNAQIPAGQLDLSGGGLPADRDATTQHVNAYTELVTGGNQQELDVNGTLQFVTILVDSGQVDAMGNPILIPQQVPEPSRIAPLSARGSTRFFDRFANGTGTVDHRGFLTPGELRLISEWVDIGAQYFNNQFDPTVPLNN